MLKPKIILILACLFTLFRAQAQQEPSFAHYWAMETSFNPAAAGKQPLINVTGAYAMTLTGFEHNPRTMFVGADMPLYLMNAYHGVGVQLMNDEIGLFSHQRLALQYAYKFKMLGGTMSVGLQLGMLSEKWKGSELDLENQNDPALTNSDASGVAIDISAGLYYMHRNWYAGLSMLHATGPAVELGDRTIYNISQMYYLTGGYNIKLRNPFLSIHPSLLAHSDGKTHRVDVTTRVKYTHEKKMFYAGVAYSPTNSITALIGGNFHGICLGYSYEVYTTTLKFGNGSHELFVGYQTELNLHKKGKNRHQSVRYL